MIFKKGGPVPTSSGGRSIWDTIPFEKGKRIFIDDFHPKGTIFSQGIISVTGDIRPGDVVLVGTDRDFRGVGRTLVSGSMMIGDVHGPAVKMIHSVK